MNHDKRFVDTGKYLTSFADEAWVLCANCNSPGVVNAVWSDYQWRACFDCTSCRLSLSSENSDWLGAVRYGGRQPCGYCGHKWLAPWIEFDVVPKDPPKHLAAKCIKCEHETMVKLVGKSHVREGLGCDPHFGMPLKLTVHTRHGVVWAYNTKHVAELLEYVTAKLRVRHPHAAHRSLLSLLPKWMKLAKHRQDISKALEKLVAQQTSI